MTLAKDRGDAGTLLEAAREGGYGLPETGGHEHGGHGGHGGHHHEPGVTSTVRTATHRGHEIKITTTYQVTIDGEPLKGMLEVLGDGRVHYHGLPQYALPSAMDMLRRVIDYFGSKSPVEDELGALIEEARP
ncbi:MAG: hypothetical protein ACRDTC_03645 [Pseudonocardiaceae bacterium]